jgi:hypothetical protein
MKFTFPQKQTSRRDILRGQHRFGNLRSFSKGQCDLDGHLFFNGMYPHIDRGTRGTINGMIAAADNILSLADNDTKIVAGHGPLGNKADLTKVRDMLITSRDRVQKLKSAGKSTLEAVAEKRFADLDPIWGNGIINGDQWANIRPIITGGQS